MSYLDKHGGRPRPGLDAEGNTIISGVRATRRYSFGEDAAYLAKHWQLEQVGGASAQAGGGQLLLTSGVQAGAKATAVLTTLQLTAPARVAVTCRFANLPPAGTDFYLELVDESGNVCAGWAFIGGQSATQGRLQTYGAGGIAAPENVGNVTLQDRVAARRTYEIQVYPDEIRFNQRDPNTTAARSTSAVRNDCVPGPDQVLQVRLRVANSSAPASSSTLSVTGVLVTDITEIPVDLTNCGGSSPAEAVPAMLVSGSVVTATAAVSSYGGGAIPVHQSILAAGIGATVVRSSPITIAGGTITNPTATDVWLKLYNQVVTPVPASHTPVMTIRVPAGSNVNLSALLPAVGLRLFNGLAFVVTAQSSKTDTTAVGAGVIVEILGGAS